MHRASRHTYVGTSVGAWKRFVGPADRRQNLSHGRSSRRERHSDGPRRCVCPAPPANQDAEGTPEAIFSYFLPKRGRFGLRPPHIAPTNVKRRVG